MARSLSYADAVRLLGGTDSKVVSALEKVTGGVLLGVAPVVPALLGWFDAKAEFVRLSHELVRGFAERRSGLSRYGRTERIEAAHTVLVVAAFFESLPDRGRPDRGRLNEGRPDEGRPAVSADEQFALGTGSPAAPGTFVQRVMSAGRLVPEPQQSLEDYLAHLEEFYTHLTATVSGVLGTGRPDRIPGRAVERYRDSLRQLMADFPEVAFWAGQQEHRATRAALAGLAETLTAISTGRAPDERRASLARAYAADLHRPVVESGDVPEGITVPTLAEAHMPPRFRAARVPSAAEMSEETWWRRVPVRNDLPDFLIGHLTSPQAVRAPLLVLGQPGSGKSVLTRVLSARLPAADFLPIRVVLRDVPAAEDVQEQIEQAIRQATGERVEWPAMARSAGDAMPVVLLDGFDELLQAVGVSQSDYLMRVARFQRREAEQGRPVAVVVTSRIAVADRARTPEDAVALRLEPFDDEQITTWLTIWNSVNARQLAPGAVLAHRALAEQPLLLLMLALYDVQGNTLQRLSPELGAAELYEELLRSFALREVTKHRHGLPERELRAAVEEELRRLSVVGFAMFNRAALWVTEADLDTDLAALPFGGVTPAGHAGLRAPLQAGELTLGRFFFIHRARARGDESRLQTYEFLHATFGEYLVARLTWHLLRDVGARDAASTVSFGAAPADDDLLRAMLSYQPLSLRTPVVEFLGELAAGAGPAERDNLRQVLLRLFRTVNHTAPPARFAAYRPRFAGEPARYACYAANLLLLVLCLGPVAGRELYPDQPDPVDAWHGQALLWRSQLTVDGWTSLVETVGLERTRTGGRRDLSLTIGWREDPVGFDPAWTFDRGVDNGAALFSYHDLHPEQLRRKAYFQCGVLDDMTHHALEPLAVGLPLSVNTFVGDEHALVSAAHVLTGLWVAPSETAYHRAAAIVAGELPLWDDETCLRLGSLLLSRLVTDAAAPPDAALTMINQLLAAARARPEVRRRLGPVIHQYVDVFRAAHPDLWARVDLVMADYLDEWELLPAAPTGAVTASPPSGCRCSPPPPPR